MHQPLRVREQLRAQIRVLREVRQAHPHRPGGRLVAREQHRHPELAHVDVGEPVAVHLRLEQHPEEVVMGDALALRDQVVDIGLGVADGVGLVSLVAQRAREHPLDPVEPQRLVLLREVHEPRQ